MPDDTGRPGGSSRRHNIVVGLIAVLIVGAAQFVVEWAQNPWSVLGGAMVIAAVTLGTLKFPDSLAWLFEKITSMPGWAKAGAAGALALVVLVAATVAAVAWSGDDDCPQAFGLRILTSPEGLQATRELAQEYARATARDNDGCPAVYPYVYAAATSAVSGALARGWTAAGTERPLDQLGPLPDLWLPDSMLDVRRVRDIVAKGSLQSLLLPVTSIGSSPIVLAGSAVSDVDATSLPELVSSLLERPAPGLSLSAADPEASAAGLLAAAVYLHDAQGVMVQPEVARRRARIVFDSTTAGTDEVSLLCSYRRERKAPAAVLVSLRTWQRFVEGRALGAGCPAPGPAAPNLPEPAVFKSGPALDHPFVQFSWTSARHREAAEHFRDWLRSENAEPHRAAAGLDDPLEACSELDVNACLPADLGATLDRYENAKRPGRVLLAVDSSGSMAEGARFTVAAQGVGAALGQLGARDEFGLWSFPVPRGRRSYELVGVATGSPQHRKAVVDRLRAVKPAGGTPLYATILAGMRELSADADDERIRALVVLTDGEDTGSSARVRQTVLGEVGRRAAGSDVRLYVIATGEARCEDRTGTAGPGLYLLAAAGRGECVVAGQGQVPETMARLFETLWSGR
ncbi:VWA domain-containing protein [Actinoplanes sp. NBC_00393]|uniref:vWA domain-containing protein n=1 Tax=Actinoplanes sp. NBC_00393 TaxID=2975953 RepID=UPI002E1D12C0